jgi:ethanolaminephosphotransferase
MLIRGRLVVLVHLTFALVALLLFVVSLFPSTPQLAGHTDPTDVPDDEHHRPPLRRVVFVVIDALRADFFSHLPLSSTGAVALECLAPSPTVTLPRLVSLVTGSEPPFLMALSNFGVSSLGDQVSDSILWQWKHHYRNRSMVFYGDDTWLRMFPGYFHRRSEGVKSFFVQV